ncbi:noncanonical pyrimidine nucleotidase, YjjG family protein [Acrocarpospora corrugata]|uniref:Noncanonical pyrimidine nucleotidase, YjjG family protein n=1 Tax=Acrocarpospora corrugata TaxID=35763 RepID=A0A5M3W9V9_9ACTN|nr:HAD family hydrolase [Acrocarpospora corrugata]GES05847.1 noncanonical pyrimidine nucleotidase, YjjG family protein [Acrocarpospora corrugata]
MQKLVLFDMDNTLIDLDAAFRLWAEEFAEVHSLGDAGRRWLLELDEKGVAHRELMFQRIKHHFDLRPTADQLWAAYRARMPQLVGCRPEVLAMVARLRNAGWLVGIVANGMADNQLGKLQNTGLAAAVDGYAVSGAEGIRKPDVALFAIAAARCGASLQGSGWMVGDNLTADIEGGRAAGLRTIWVNPEQPANPALNHTIRSAGPEAGWARDSSPDHVVGDVLDAEPIIVKSHPDMSL